MQNQKISDTIKFINLYTKNMHLKFFMYSVLDILFNLVNVCIPYLFGKIIDYTLSCNMNMIFTDCIWLIICLICVTSLCCAKKVIIVNITNKLTYELKKCVMEYAVYNNRKFVNRGIYISKLDDVDRIVGFITNILCPAFATIISFIFMVYISFNISFTLSFIQILVIPINIVYAYKYGKKVSKWETQIIKLRDGFFSYIYEMLDGIEEFISLKIENNIMELFNNKNKIYLNELKKNSMKTLKWSQIFSFIIGIIQIIMLLFSCWLILNQKLSVGEYYTFNSYASNINSIGNTFIGWFTQLSSITSVFSHISTELKQDHKEIILNQQKIYNLKSDNITMYYDNACIFKDICFELKQGEIMLLKGKNGAGKSTLMKILANIISPSNGNVIINDIKTKPNMRYRVTYFGTNSFLFNKSIIENITIALAKYNEDDVVNVCKSLGIDSYINKLPLKYNTIIGEKGEKLSRGQIQGIALARAFLLDSDVYLFDEATTYLDCTIRKKFYLKLMELKNKNKIIIVASHDEKNVDIYDCIYEL